MKELSVENEQESVTETRVRLYRKALAQQREINELAERKAEQAKEAEAEIAKEPHEPSSDRDQTTAHEHSDKA
jgi:hypothetical protein